MICIPYCLLLCALTLPAMAPTSGCPIPRGFIAMSGGLRRGKGARFQWLWLLLSLLVAPNFSAAQTAGDPEKLPNRPPSIHVDVRLINVFVNVTDNNGAPVPRLTKESFALAEDGHPQKISFFERESAMPLAITMAIDTSGSVRKDLPLEQEAAHKFVHTLLRPVDLFSLIDFSSDVREVVTFTNRASRIDDGLQRLRPGPATALYDAVYLGSLNLAPHKGRKVLLIISDGDNTVDGMDYPRALEAAVRSEVMVYSIIDVPIAADAGRNTGGEHALISLAQETGGKYYYAEASQLNRALEQVSEDLRTQYLLGYYPARRSTADFHTISVAVNSGDPASTYTVRHRTGYYSTPMK